jgi:Thioredoxin
MSLRRRYCAAPTFEMFRDGTEANADLWLAVARRASVPDDLVRRSEATGDRWHLLVLAEDWCGDAVQTLPFAAKLADAASNIDLRVVGRDANPDLMSAHLTGQSRSIPVVILLDANFQERGWWGPRPVLLQEWALGEGASLSNADRYREVRRWYARDRGISTLTEIVELMERAMTASATVRHCLG